MNPDSYGYSACVQEEVNNARHYARKDERAKLAQALTRIRAKANAHASPAERNARIEAIAEVASAMGLTREETVTYHA